MSPPQKKFFTTDNMKSIPNNNNRTCYCNDHYSAIMIVFYVLLLLYNSNDYFILSIFNYNINNHSNCNRNCNQIVFPCYYSVVEATNNHNNNDNNNFPIQLIPVYNHSDKTPKPASSVSSAFKSSKKNDDDHSKKNDDDDDNITYTMWTPQNWTTTIPNIKQLDYNLYLIQSKDSHMFQIIIPSKTIQTTTTPLSSRGNNKYSNMTSIRMDTTQYYDTSNYIQKIHPQLRNNDYNSYHHYHHHNTNTNNPFFLQRTRQQSDHYHCYYAMNGGPFHSDGTMVGVVMIHIQQEKSRIVSSDFGPNIGFGIATGCSNNYHRSSIPTTNHTTTNTYWVIGPLHNTTQIQELGIQQFVTGFDWLVYNTTNVVDVVNNTNDDGGAYRASRSAIGITADGILLLLVSDGCEHCLRHQGMTLYEMAELLLYFGAQYGINMDGGSSSTLVYNPKHNKTSTTTSEIGGSIVLNQPKCFYNALVPYIPCERAVGTVICLH